MKKGLLSAAVGFLVLMSTVIAAEPAFSDDLGKADKLFAAGKYQEALILYQKILPLPPANVTPGDINSKIGDTYFRLADYRNALEAYQRAIKDQRPADRPQTQYWIGFCSFLIGRDEIAITEFLKVPTLYPDAKAWGSTSYYWAGRASERLGKKEQAAEYYRKAGGSGKTTQSKFAQKKAEAVKGTNAKSQASNSK
jgi:tetratricopeptide (TPR) repeat protein